MVGNSKIDIGFDVILIETVGLGQNEIEIDNVSDLVMYIVPPGSGDALQGGKKGIMEVADLITVSKCDGRFEPSCKKIKKDIEEAIQFQTQRYPGWVPPVIMSSAELNKGMDEIYKNIRNFQTKRVKDIIKKRYFQNINNLWSYVTNVLTDRLQNDETPFSEYIKTAMERLEKDSDYLPYEAAQYVLEKVFGEYDSNEI